VTFTDFIFLNTNGGVALIVSAWMLPLMMMTLAIGNLMTS
jgi:hypothetical protein